MREHEDRLTPEEAFRRRLVYEVEQLAGEIEAICVDMQYAAKPRFVDHGTARSIRAIVKDDHFVRVVNKLNLVEQTIKDPKTAERILSDCLTGNGITEWADAQPIDEKERWLQGKAEVMLSNSVFGNINDALLRSMPSENVGGPPYLSKHEGSPLGSRPDDDSEADQSDAHSPDEVWVRPYKQQRHGKTVPVRGYPRHHTPSQHEGEHSVAADTDSEATDVDESQLAQFHRDAEAYLEQKKAMFNNNSDTPEADTAVSGRTDGRSPVIPASSSIQGSGENSEEPSGSDNPHDHDANYAQGYRDAYRQLMNPSTGLLTSPSNADKRPGYGEGFRNAVNEIRQDPMWQKGFNDARNGTVNQQKMNYPYYRQGVLDTGDDSAGEPYGFDTALVQLGLGVAARAALRAGIGAGAAGDAATQSTPGPGQAPGPPLSPTERKAIRSNERQIAKHEQKLKDYISNPDANDNRDLLKNARTPEIRDQIIRGRIKKLQEEIEKFRREIEKIKGGRDR